MNIQPLKTILKLTMEKKSDIMSVYTTTVVFAVFVFALSLCFYKSGYEEKWSQGSFQLNSHLS